MTYRIEQDFENAGKDYWHWRAWIEAGAQAMEQVSKVVWILHPSFKRTRVEVSQPANGFRLVTAGWGTFRLRAEVVLKSGQVLALSRNLKFEYPDDGADEGSRRSAAGGDFSTRQEPEPQSKPVNRSAARAAPLGERAGQEQTDAEARRPAALRTVFLSYSGEDSRAASRLRGQLESAGISVLDASRVESGQSWSEAVRQMLSRADSVIGLVTEQEASPFVVDELQAALAADKPALALVPVGSSHRSDQAATLFGLPSSVQQLEFDLTRGDSSDLVSLIRRQPLG